jgi:hypothetical protein
MVEALEIVEPAGAAPAAEPARGAAPRVRVVGEG